MAKPSTDKFYDRLPNSKAYTSTPLGGYVSVLLAVNA